MKKRFIVSAYRTSLKNCKDIFIAEPYVLHVLEKNNLDHNYTSIYVAPFTRHNKNDIISDSNYVNEKYVRYLPILTHRLNIIHETNYSEIFWQKYLSLGFVRYITSFYDTYKIIDEYFEEENFSCEILNQNLFFTPSDFEEHRQCFTNSDFGQEQILSIYINHKFPNKFPVYNEIPQNNIPTRKILQLISILGTKLRKITFKSVLRKLNENWLKIKFSNTEKNVEVGLLGCFFSHENYSFLKNRSKNKICNLIFTSPIKTSAEILSLSDRKFISQKEVWFDNFDSFFFYSMQFCLPKICIEYYKSLKFSSDIFFDNHPKLKFIISEAWTGDSIISILLTFGGEKGIKHIYNEHNCIFHPFEGRYVEHVAPLCDIYATIGWYRNKYNNLISLSSLFQFNLVGRYTKKYKILYISTPLMVRMQHFSSAWGFSAECVPKNIQFCSLFFSNLEANTLNEISYRPYPPKNIRHILVYDKEYILKKFISNLKEITNTDELSKVQMRQSKLVVLDYISTSYIECLVMNIPFIFFWDPNSYYLKDEFTDFFTPLVNVGVCQTDAVKAALFVEKIKEDPGGWWFSSSVQEGRKKFMKDNLGEPQVMIDYLLSLTNKTDINNKN